MKTLLRNSISLRSACLFFLAIITAPAVLPPALEEMPNLDRRPKIEAASLKENHRSAIATLKASTPDATVDFAGQPNARWVSAERGFLTGPGGRGRSVSAATLALFPTNETHLPSKAFVKEHPALFGFGPDALDRARVKREFTTSHNGLKTVVWEQHL